MKGNGEIPAHFRILPQLVLLKVVARATKGLKSIITDTALSWGNDDSKLTFLKK